jgi:hypothetical protein
LSSRKKLLAIFDVLNKKPKKLIYISAFLTIGLNKKKRPEKETDGDMISMAFA